MREHREAHGPHVRMASAFLLLLAIGPACTRDEPGFSRVGGLRPARPYLLDVRSFVRRFDGDIRAVFSARVTADRDQIVCVMGLAGGSDQGCVFVLEADGSPAAGYRVSGVTPWLALDSMRREEGEPRRQRQCPDNVEPLQHGSRRLLMMSTTGIWFPSSFILLEAPELEERLVFWNQGTISRVRRDRPRDEAPSQSHYVAILGRNNAFLEEDQYRAFLAIFSLEDVLRRGREDESQSPDPKDPPEDPDAPYRLYLVAPTDGGRDAFDFVRAEWSGATLVATTGTGLVYRVDPEARTFRVDADEEYQERYAKRLEGNPDLPPVVDHVRELERGVDLFTGRG